MADQGRWYKLWCSALDDPDLDNLSIADFGRWAKLGTFIKAQGNKGSITLKPPARSLCAMMQVESFDGLIECIKRLPHCLVRGDENSTVSNETIVTVTFSNWTKYQGDFSTDRVVKHRQMKRSKRRGEEKRREQYSYILFR